MTDLLVDAPAFATDAAMMAAIRKAAREQGADRYAVVEDDGQGYAAVTWAVEQDNTPGIVTTPDRLDRWALVLQDTSPTEEDVTAWTFRMVGLERTKAREIARRVSVTDLEGRSKAWERLILSTRWGGLARIAQNIRAAMTITAWEPTWQPVPLPQVEVRAGRDYRLLDDAGVEEALHAIQAAPVVALDFETEGQIPLGAQPVGFSFSVRPGEAVYVPLSHEGLSNMGRAQAMRILTAITSRPWLAHNAKFEWHVLENIGIRPAVTPDDTMLLAWHTGTERKGLKWLARELLGEVMDTYADVTSKVPFRQQTLEKVLAYGGADADMNLRLFQAGILDVPPRALTLYHEVDKPLIPITADMERRGVRLDMEWLAGWEASLEAEINEQEILLDSWARTAGESKVNWNSPEQVSRLLFSILDLDPQRRGTKRGIYSVDEDTLLILETQHPLIPVLREYRGKQKLLGTYARGMQEAGRRYGDGRLHGLYNIGGTKTGRLSSEDPNMQNIPLVARKGVIADEGMVFVSADYSQVELRIAAALSGEPLMIEDFRSGGSPHKRTMLKVFGTDDKGAHPKLYTLAKNVNFGTLYGVGPDKLVAQAREGGVKTTREEMARSLEGHRQLYTRLWAWIEEQKRRVRRMGYAETLQGRRAYYPDIKHPDRGKQMEAERQGVNMPIQGTAGYYGKVAMVRWGTHLTIAPLAIQVHDEIVVQTNEDAARDVQEALEVTMQSAADFELAGVPIETEGNSAQTWKELK